MRFCCPYSDNACRASCFLLLMFGFLIGPNFYPQNLVYCAAAAGLQHSITIWGGHQTYDFNRAVPWNFFARSESVFGLDKRNEAKTRL